MTNTNTYEKARCIYKEYKTCKELQNKINLRTVLSVLLTATWYYIWTTSAIAYFQKPWATFNPKNIIMYITIIVLIIAPSILFKPQRYLNFKPFVGVIVKNDVTHSQYSYALRRTFAVFTIKSLDGNSVKKIKVKAVNNIFTHFCNGSQVVLLRGLKYPVKINYSEDKTPEDAVFCPWCGHFNPRRFGRCFECSTISWNNTL